MYRHTDIADIVNQARLRGIRVIPEFDTPGKIIKKKKLYIHSSAHMKDSCVLSIPLNLLQDIHFPGGLDKTSS